MGAGSFGFARTPATPSRWLGKCGRRRASRGRCAMSSRDRARGLNVRAQRGRLDGVGGQTHLSPTVRASPGVNWRRSLGARPRICARRCQSRRHGPHRLFGRCNQPRLARSDGRSSAGRSRRGPHPISRRMTWNAYSHRSAGIRHGWGSIMACLPAARISPGLWTRCTEKARGCRWRTIAVLRRNGARPEGSRIS